MHLEHLMDALSSTRVSPVEGRKVVFERLNQSLQKALKDLPKVDPQYAEISGVIEAEMCRELVLRPVLGGEGIRKAANAQIENVEIRFGKVFGEVQNDEGRLVQISVLENEVAVKQDEWYHLPELDGWLFSGLVEKLE